MQLALSTYQNRGNFYLSSKKSISYSCSNLELSNHLGNVLSVISDKVIPHPSGGSVAYYKADILQAMDYSPFGVTLKGRNLKKTGNLEEFRFGFQGQEFVNEVSGNGNHYSAQFWEYNPRLARRFNLDPVVKTHESPYACFANNPIWFVDPNGADTLNGAKVIEDAKRLNEMEAKIASDRIRIEEMVKNRDNIKQMIEDIERDHDISTFVSDVNPTPKNKANKIVDGINEANEKAIEALKATYICMELQIMKDINTFNENVDYYNSELMSLHVDLGLMDSDDKLGFINQQSGKPYFYSQNTTNQKAKYRFSVGDVTRRFGKVDKSFNSTVIHLDYAKQVKQITLSLDMLGLDAESLIEETDHYKSLDEAMRKQFKELLKKGLK